ncbi:MAG: ABC transporter substrate-binding protein [Pseudomonadota bacterium]
MTALILRYLIVAVVAGSLATPANAQTTTVTDVLDRTVEIPENPQRILLGFYFEDFFAVGGPDAYDRVVAISREAWEGWRNQQWKAYAAAVPRIAEVTDVGEVDSGTFSLEAALATRPDVALIADWQYTALGDTVGRLEAAGVPVVVLDYNAQTVDRHVASTRALGKVLGIEDRAQALADLYAGAVADVRARVSEAEARPKVHFELGNKGADEPGFSWGDVMWGRLVEVAGGTNIAKDKVAKWAPVEPEYVLAQKPDFVFLAGSGWLGRDNVVLLGPGVDAETTHARMAPYLQRPGWAELPAVKQDRVFGVYHGGTRTLYDFTFLQFIAKALHPDLFADVDPQKNLEDFFDQYMPIKATGTYMTQMP